LVLGEDVGLDGNAGKTKYVSMFCEQSAGLIHNIHTANESFQSIGEFKYGSVSLIQHPWGQTYILDYLMVYGPRFWQVIFVTTLRVSVLVNYSYFIINRAGFFNYHRSHHGFSFRMRCCNNLTSCQIVLA